MIQWLGMKRQFTATVFILHEGKTLMLFHNKHKIWSPPGGHVEANETPSETARREVLEETGLEIAFYDQEQIWIDLPGAKSVERPHHILLEHVPETAREEAHEHIDFIYVARPVKMHSPKEEQILRWFTLEELQQLIPGKDMFPDILETCNKIFSYEKGDICSSNRPACGQDNALARPSIGSKEAL